MHKVSHDVQVIVDSFSRTLWLATECPSLAGSSPPGKALRCDFVGVIEVRVDKELRIVKRTRRVFAEYFNQFGVLDDPFG